MTALSAFVSQPQGHDFSLGGVVIGQCARGPGKSHLKNPYRHDAEATLTDVDLHCAVSDDVVGTSVDIRANATLTHTLTSRPRESASGQLGTEPKLRVLIQIKPAGFTGAAA